MLVDLCVMILAANHLTLLTRESEIFAGVRAWLEATDTLPGRAIGCAFCWSHWASAAVLALWGIHHVIMWFAGVDLIAWPTVMLLAVVRGANLLHDLTRKYDRTPRHDDLGLQDLIEEKTDDERR